MTNQVIISKETIKRLVKDVKELKNNSLGSHGIFYEHDDSDILKGRAVIIGSEKTPYFAGFYFFLFKFPSDYPFSPPYVTICSNGDKIRMNPNLYTNGKVCISILNTWSGEQWSSCQSISSVLLNLKTLLCADPFLNEPGVTKLNREFENYTKIIEYKNIEICIFHMIKKNKPYYNNEFDCFEKIIHESFESNCEKVKEFILSKIQENPQPQTIHHRFYSMDVVIDYQKLLLSFPDSVTMKA